MKQTIFDIRETIDTTPKTFEVDLKKINKSSLKSIRILLDKIEKENKQFFVVVVHNENKNLDLLGLANSVFVVNTFIYRNVFNAVLNAMNSMKEVLINLENTK